MRQVSGDDAFHGGRSQQGGRGGGYETGDARRPISGSARLRPEVSSDTD